MEIDQLTYELGLHNSQIALKHLFLYYHPRLLLFVSYYIKSKEICEEIVSDTFVTVWERRGRLIEVQNFNAYIYVIAKNHAIDYLRKNDNPINIDISEIEYLVKAQSDPEMDLITADLMDRLDSAVESLPERCRMIFRLVRDHNLKHEEVAKILQISKKTLEGHMTLAIKRLRNRLNV